MAPWTLKRLERAVESFSAQLQCAICLCAYDSPVSLPCNHCFCEECIHRALELKALCPICKTPAKKRRLRYDTTVQELLRATEMLCSAPAATDVQLPVKKDKNTEKETPPPAATAAATVKTEPKQVPIAADKGAAATPERKSSRRRRAARDAQPKTSPGSQTLMDAWISGGSTSLHSQLVKMKTEKQTATPTRRASPRRAVARTLHSQMEESPMSPALFEISVPKILAAAPIARIDGRGRAESTSCEDVMTQIDAVDDQTVPPRRQSNADTEVLDEDETQLDAVEVRDQQTRSIRRRQVRENAVIDAGVDETQLEAVEPKQQALSPRRRRSSTSLIVTDEIEAESQSEEMQTPPSPCVRRSSRNVITTNEDASETQLEEVRQQTKSPGRRSSIGETQVEGIGPKLRTPILRERRRSAAEVTTGGLQQQQMEQQHLGPRRRKSVSVSIQDKDQAAILLSPQQTPAVRSHTQLRSSTDEVATNLVGKEAQVGNVATTQQTLAPLKRRRSETNGVDDTTHSKTSASTHQSNGIVVPTNGVAANLSLVIDGQAQLPLEIDTFHVGDLVDVIERQWPGINKRGGAARIISVHGDGFYNVKFLVGTGTDKHVPAAFIRRPAEDITSESTPGRAVRKRQRRRRSDIMASTDPPTPRPRSSPHSEKKLKPKSNAITKHSGMVFLCSGFKEDRMRQIDEWAELLGAEVVQYWSNHVTHLIVKCVSADEVNQDEHSMDELDLVSSPLGRNGDKRKLFCDPKPGRWVKIRSLKYLKALVGGRWIVSDEWLQACADHGGYVSEVNYEADGHWKGRRIHDPVKRSRETREKLLRLSSPNVKPCDIGTMLFADFCFHVIGEFLPPMPPITELNTLICMGGGKLIPFMDDIPDEMHKRENRTRKLVIVSDKLNPSSLRQQTRRLKAQPQLKVVSAAIIVNYLWVINSISEAKLRELPC